MSQVENLLRGYPVVVRQDVVWGDMDAYGHVNNVVYFRYFENSRVEYLRRIGWKEFDSAPGVGPIVSALKARFRKPVVFPDAIAVGTRLATLQEDRFTLHHVIVSSEQAAVVTEGESTVVTYDYAAKRKAHVPEAMRQRILALESAAGSAG